MSTDGGSVFVGRVAELDELRRGLDEVRTGRGRLFMLSGEAGIGKTRLADQLAGEAGEQGVHVLFGRCWESGGAPAYWPWVQALRSYVSRLDTEVLAQQLGPGAADLAQILPEIRTRLKTPETAATLGPEHARFQFFDAFTNFLRAAAAQRNLILVLEDLHAADQPSLLLLQFVARELRALPMLVIGTARPVDRARDAVVADLLAAIAREGRRIVVPALMREDVERYLSSATTSPPPAETVDAVYTATQGNPLFVSEVLHLLRDHGRTGGGASALHLPVALRTAIRQRVAALPEATRGVLDLAAVIGREFDVGVLERIWTPPPDVARRREALLDALEHAVSAGVIGGIPGTVGRYTFAHALIRDTIADDLPWPTRISVHRQVGEALELMWAANPAQHLAEIAHHFVAAAPDGEVDKALDYARRAGDRAMALLAYEEAAQHYERAKEVLALRTGPPRATDEVLRCDLLLSLGDAAWGAGDVDKMREHMQLAAQSARMLADVIGRKEAAARTAYAALGFGGRQQRAHGVFDPDIIRLLEEARAALGDEDAPLRARVLARLAYAIYLQPDSLARREALSREAVAVARRCGDPLTLRLVLNDARWATWHPDTIDERRQIADELALLTHRSGDREMALKECTWRMVDLLELGDAVGVDTELAECARIAKEVPGGFYDGYIARFQATRYTLEGRFDEAERAAKTYLESPTRTPLQDSILEYGTQIVNVRIQQGRLDEAAAALRSYAAQHPAVIILQYAIPFVHAELGQADEARLELERIDPTGRAELRRDWTRLPGGAFIAETCSFLGDTGRAESLYAQLLPYAERCVIIAHGVGCYGSLARYLGLLASTIGDDESAAAHYETALRVNSRMRARPFVARTQHDYARLLLAHGERARASELLGKARETAVELGMRRLQERVDEIFDRGVKVGAAGAGASTVEAVVSGQFRQTGETWSIRFGDTTFQLKAVLGLTYIAHLLRHPGVEFHVTDLVDLAEGRRPAASARLGEAVTVRSLGDAGEVIDAQAKAEYRRRLSELREELEEAESLNDLGRAEHMRAEIEALGGQLAEAIGIGGRHRRAGSHVERARVSVTKRVTKAIRKMDEFAPLLAAHLRSRIKTGTLCTYDPDPGRPVVWEL
jgi:tetratricopeptide (TPR) repeat protein